MFRSAVAAVLAFLLLGTFVAAGAHLTVDGPILQSFSYDVDYVPPPTTEVDLYVEVHTYAGNSSRPMGTARLGPYDVPADAEYFVSYDGTGRACPGEELATRIGGPFVVTGDDHLICVQHGDADGRIVTVRVGDDTQGRAVVLNAAELAAATAPLVGDRDAL